MKIAVIGGGINGVMASWELARSGHEVELFEQGSLMQATSASTSKMLHGGIRYLEQGHFGLVREALHERKWWLDRVPNLVRMFALLIPVYRQGDRGRLLLGAGVKLYDFLANGSGFPPSRWLDKTKTLDLYPYLSRRGLVGAWEYWDAQMDDQKLGHWAADRARDAGVLIHENSFVMRLFVDGVLEVGGTKRCFDRIINATGPWARVINDRSGIQSQTDLSLVRGSHLIIRKNISCGYVLQRMDDRRIVFLLPWHGKSLLGTTEVLQTNPEAQPASEKEIDYLLETYNQFFEDFLKREDITETFSGVRPIVRKGNNFSGASRESVIERHGKLVSVFGGKWTTSRVLAKSVAQIVEKS